MTSKIKIIKEEGNFEVKLGERTLELIKRLEKLNEEEKETLLKESAEILSHCVNPIDTIGQITGLAVGYVQSGKTMSFTTLSTLAIDNGFRAIIYFAGTKNNLLEQTTNRLKRDLLTSSKNRKNYKVYQNPLSDDNHTNNIHNAFKQRNSPTILITILKSEKYITELAKLFSSYEIKTELGNNGVLIIDDEADQASLNRYARSNCKSADWEENQYSSTYASILKLKSSLPNHSYIQYTATPQGPLLINLMDLLSPEFHVVLTPGGAYTGGKAFFVDNPDLILAIPPKEVYHHKKNNLTECPESLVNALQVYLIGVALQVNIYEKEEFLSMMIHADRETDASKKFISWVSNIITSWGDKLALPDSDPGKLELLSSFEKNYNEAVRRIDSTPSFEKIMFEVLEVILDTNIHLVIGKNNPEVKSGNEKIDWNNASSHILIGADLLDRGFTVEGLAITYMPRNSVSKSNADTIQQRCRFFGYKKSYLDSCRVYLPIDSILDYCEYVEHEEIIRKQLKSSTLRELEQVMVLGDQLNPTRNNILSDDVIRHKLNGWRQMNALEHINENIEYVENFISSQSFEIYEDYGTVQRNHKFIKLPINDVIEFLNKFKIAGVPDALRKSSTIQYLRYLADKSKIDYAYIFLMAYDAPEGRERRLNDVNEHLFINNIFMGRSNDGGETYPGDKGIKMDDSLCIQIHKVKLKHNSSKWNQTKLYTLGLYYPEELSHTLIGIVN
ncbi:Z1 domain-containing protein [Sediminicola luteus]|uniref:Z1 domain-containing protein n=1 Tax=Sediminicola luteus TaxID=319238 RepID=A0ABV2TWY9_9FLAO